MTTGPGLIMPIATATRNSRSFSQPVCCTSPFSRKGTITSPLPNVSDPAFRKNVNSLPSIAPCDAPSAAANKGSPKRKEEVVEVAARRAEQGAVVEDADGAGRQEDPCDLGTQRDRDAERDSRQRPRKPVVHAELGQPVTRKQDQRDDGGAHAVEDRGDPG